MTIKAIKAKYARYRAGEYAGENSFTVYDWKDGNGKCVVVVGHVGLYGYKDVIQVVRVSDGAELLDGDRCRPCDNLDDAIDVAAEMLGD